MARLKQSETEALAARMAATEQSAFKEFSDEFGPRLRAFFISKGLRAGEAEDLAVSSVSDISRKVEKYERRENGSFEAWVFTIARRLLSDWRKKHPEYRPLPEGAPSDEPVTEKSPRHQAALRAVNEAYEGLSETDQMILQLRHLEEERTFAEIGEVLGITDVAARVRHNRAIAHLKAKLTDDSRVAHLQKLKNEAAKENE